MNVRLSDRAIAQLAVAPPAIQKAFIKQISFLSRDVTHPSIHAKKYDETDKLWQGRVNQDWRFYYTVLNDCYRVEAIVPHPK
jgi:mRNA-degrading endonuclease RelE of RelBE toxin-antitoxin system